MEESKTAVVLLNMGGPSSLFEVKTFLQNMFFDPYILPIKSDFLRKMVASFIVNKRLETAQSNYQKIGGKSPLIQHTTALCALLNSQSAFFFTYAMRYTPPFSHNVVQELKQKKFERIVLFSLYPHFSYTTTASSMEDFLSALKKQDFFPQILQVERYFQNKLYHQAILKRIQEALGGEDSHDFHLVFSAHSLPQRNIDNGDPYQKEILENVALLESMLKERNLEFASVKIAYQSKIGPIKWLEPNLQNCLPQYKGKKLLIYPISFTMDNSETDFELSYEYRNFAEKVGIKDYRVARCLNDSEDFAQCIIEIVESFMRDFKKA